MFAPLIIDLLIGCFLLILAGWASDILAGWASDEIRAGRRDLDSVRPTSWNQMGRPRKPLPFDDPDATWTPRPVRRWF
jgi:hypothetical protein